MKVKKLENFQNKIGLTGCKWSRIDAPGQHTQTTGFFDGESAHIFCPPLTDDVEGSSVIYRRFMTGNDCGGDGKTSMSRDEPCCVQEEREDDDEMLQMRYPSPIVVASIRCTDHNARGDTVVIAQIGTEIGLARCSDPASTDNAVTECECRSSELIPDETEAEITLYGCSRNKARNSA